MATVLINSDSLDSVDRNTLKNGLRAISKLLDQPIPKAGTAAQSILRKYMTLSEKQTSDVAKRAERQKCFKQLLDQAQAAAP